MREGCYLFSVRELALEEPDALIWKKVYKRLDPERLGKVKEMRNMGKKASSAGAGLLLQWAVRHAGYMETCSMDTALGKGSMECGRTISTPVTEISLTELLSQLQEPICLQYTYGEKGKPYFQNLPFFFNLSHSGDYVLCALSEQEIGVDIQQQVKSRDTRIADRFFSESEKELIAGCSTEEERQSCFYRLWTRKEAYGKLTGEGIAAALKKDFSDLQAEWMQEISFEEMDFPEGYKIAVCRYTESANPEKDTEQVQAGHKQVHEVRKAIARSMQSECKKYAE